MKDPRVLFGVIVSIVATALTAWTDVSDSFLSGVRDGFRGTGE